jgi:hypothetical protein
LLLDRFIVGLEPWQPANREDLALLRPGRELADLGAQPFFAPNPYEAIGALMVGEIFAKKMDKCLADQIRRQDRIPREALTWLIIHEALEVDHADDANDLADLIPDAQLSAIWRGAEHQWTVLWAFMTGVYQAAASCARHQ